MTCVKAPVTLRAALIERTQAPVPVHAPDQPEKLELGPAAAASVTIVAGSNHAAQSAPQSMPDGVESIVPVPVPLRTAASCAQPAAGGWSRWTQAWISSSQRSTVQAAVSAQAGGVPAWQRPVPRLQVSTPLQKTPSSHSGSELQRAGA